MRSPIRCWQICHSRPMASAIWTLSSPSRRCRARSQVRTNCMGLVLSKALPGFPLLRIACRMRRGKYGE